MQKQICTIHGVDAKWVEAGVSKKTGKPFNGFWSCPMRVPGGRCNIAPVEAGGDAGFDAGLNSDLRAEQEAKKQRGITKAVAIKATVELIAPVLKPFAEPPSEEQWLAWQTKVVERVVKMSDELVKYLEM